MSGLWIAMIILFLLRNKKKLIWLKIYIAVLLNCKNQWMGIVLNCQKINSKQIVKYISVIAYKLWSIEVWSIQKFDIMMGELCMNCLKWGTMKWWVSYAWTAWSRELWNGGVSYAWTAWSGELWNGGWAMQYAWTAWIVKLCRMEEWAMHGLPEERNYGMGGELCMDCLKSETI